MLNIENIVKKILRIVLIIFLTSTISLQYSTLSSSLFTKECSKENKEYIVVKVFDGDTILIGSERQETRSTKQEKIRLLGIDAFEHDQMPYGKYAKDFLTKLVLNKKVCIETDVQEKDVYRRTLGYVFLKSTGQQVNKSTSQNRKPTDLETRRPVDLFINEELLKNGLAILYDFPPNVKYIERLKKAQIYARQNMLGVWEKHSYIIETPAQWRHKHPFKKQNRKQKTS